jgi:hypothetical protein
MWIMSRLSGLEVIDGGEILVEGVNLAGLGDNRRTGYRASYQPSRAWQGPQPAKCSAGSCRR